MPSGSLGVRCFANMTHGLLRLAFFLPFLPLSSCSSRCPLSAHRGYTRRRPFPPDPLNFPLPYTFSPASKNISPLHLLPLYPPFAPHRPAFCYRSCPPLPVLPFPPSYPISPTAAVSPPLPRPPPRPPPHRAKALPSTLPPAYRDLGRILGPQTHVNIMSTDSSPGLPKWHQHCQRSGSPFQALLYCCHSPLPFRPL